MFIFVRNSCAFWSDWFVFIGLCRRSDSGHHGLLQQQQRKREVWGRGRRRAALLRSLLWTRSSSHWLRPEPLWHRFPQTEGTDAFLTKPGRPELVPNPAPPIFYCRAETSSISLVSLLWGRGWACSTGKSALSSSFMWMSWMRKRLNPKRHAGGGRPVNPNPPRWRSSLFA